MPISSSGRIWDKFYPLDPIHFISFAGFHWDISGNWINIYSLSHNAVVLGKNKTFKDPILAKTGATWAIRKNKLNFFSGNNKKR